MKEYGGIYHDMNFICNSSFDKLLDEFDKNIDKNTIFIAKFEKTYLDYIFPFSKPKYCSCFMAFEKEHPLWDKVINIILKVNNRYQITSALNISLINNHEYNIIILDKVTGNYQNKNKNKNKDIICYTLSEKSENTITEYMKFIILYYKQILLFILVFVIIFIIDRINHHNYKLFGIVQMIPGTNIPQQINTAHQIKKNEKNKKKIKKNYIVQILILIFYVFFQHFAQIFGLISICIIQRISFSSFYFSKFSSSFTYLLFQS
jgi:hypothetical protein